MFKDFISLLFPHCCVISGKPLARGEKWIASDFAMGLPRFDLQTSNDKMEQKFSGLVRLEYALAFYKFRKKSGVQKLLHALKYQNYPEVGEMAGRWFGHAMVEAGHQQHFDLIVPVPLHYAKRRKRGYNQCDHIAIGLSEITQIPWQADVLLRTDNRESQTKKSRRERFDNADNIYQLADPALVRGKRVLIIDDVITTGATIISCARLLENKAAAVSAAALASAE
jgi:ComF family protein